MDNNILSEINEDSFYLYDRKSLETNYKNFLNVFTELYPKVELAYSFKTNYIPQLCKHINELGGISEVVSDMELDLALKLDVPNKKIIYNGPYKTIKSLKKALNNNVIIHIDSLDEYLNIEHLLKQNHSINKCLLGIRMNLDLKENQISRFGLDINSKEFIEILKLLQNNKKIKLLGIHCHLPHRDLKSFKIRIKKMLEIYNQYFIDKIEYIDIGGGFPSKLDKALAKQLNIEVKEQFTYAKIICNELNIYFQDKEVKNLPKLILEPGTAIVADTLNFFTKIIAKKTIRGKTILQTSGSKFNFMGLSTKHIDFSFKEYYMDDSKGRTLKTCDVGGYTCIESDYILKNIKSKLDVGDYICIENVGSYSIVMKPPFILPNSPIIEYHEKKINYIKRKETFEDIFNTYKF